MVSKLVLSLFLLSFSAEAHNLAEIEGAAIFLRHIADSDLKKGNKSSCGLSAKEALSLTQPLKAIRDAALQKEKEKLQRTPKLESAIASCEKKCHCGIYSDLLEERDGWSGEYAVSSAKAAKENKKTVAKCAKREALWFCKSPLLRELRAKR
jgi:hypothetical protein